ncbi:MAG: DUF167 domain-containing protein [bacterium]|nr:DUF167 domain-containing protein [bacterium]
MKIFVKVKPNAKKELLKKVDDMHFVISVTAPPKDGKANRAVLRVLSDYLGVPPSRLEILTGHTSRFKVIAVH